MGNQVTLHIPHRLPSASLKFPWASHWHPSAKRNPTPPPSALLKTTKTGKNPPAHPRGRALARSSGESPGILLAERG